MTMTTTEPVAPDADTPKAFFVYGTLRPGFGNSRFWAGRASVTSDGTAYLHGANLTTDGPFPFAVRSMSFDDVVTGTLIWPHSDTFAEVQEAFDMLEGHPHFYTRTVVNVMDEDGDMVKCYTYFLNGTHRHGRWPVVGNDWKIHVETQREVW